MSTEKQIAANRLNAQKSTGPRTEEGRAAVRHNAVKHGLCAKTLVLPDEDEAEFQALFDNLEETFQPANPAEAFLVRQMALAASRLDRANHIEGAFFHFELKDDAGIRNQYHPNLDLYGKLAYMMQDESNGRKLSTLVRHQAHFERSYHRNMRALERLQTLRNGAATVRERSCPEPSPKSISETDLRQQPTTNTQHPPFGSVPKKPKQPIPINQIKDIEPKPAQQPIANGQQPLLNSQQPPSHDDKNS